MKIWRFLLLFLGFLSCWQLIIFLFDLPPYILPSPYRVLNSFKINAALLLKEALPTVLESLVGLFLGGIFGAGFALSMIYYRCLRPWFLPILLISQAIPTFAIAPLLVIWFGYGVTSKVVITSMMLFFPMASSFYDGMRRTPPGMMDLARIMDASRHQLVWRIQVPLALPSLGSGIRVAATIAPIGAVIGEWVGASQGLGFLMLNANARMQIDLMFAALIVIIVFSLLLYYAVDKILLKILFWVPRDVA